MNLIKRSTEIRHDVTRDVCLMMTKKLADTMENAEFRTMIMENFAAADEGGLEEDEGCLNFKEFAPVVKDILRLWTGSTMDDKSLREYFEKFDRDNNRMLDEDEFVEFVEYLFVLAEYHPNENVRSYCYRMPLIFLPVKHEFLQKADCLQR